MKKMLLVILLFPATLLANIDTEPETVGSLAYPSEVKYSGCSISPDQRDFVSKRPVTYNVKGVPRTFPVDTYFRIDDNLNRTYHFSAYTDETSPGIEFDVRQKDSQCDKLMPIEFKPDAFGELEAQYTIEMKVAGKTQPVKRVRKVTNCYRYVKQMARQKYGIELTGVPAYSAYDQLVNLHFKKTTEEKAPIGAICVYNAGGKVTASGGHKYGHIQMRKACGWDYGYGCKTTNPATALGRPFMGCFYK
jgi:hypothetical protein